MQTFRRPNSARGFGLVDTMMGLLILTVAAASFSYAFQTVAQVSHVQSERVQSLLEEADGQILAPNL